MVDTFLAAGLGNAVLATLLAVVAAVVGRLTRRPALSRALWLLVLLKLVTPPFVPLPVPWPERTPEAIPAPVSAPEPVALCSPVTLGAPVVLEEALPPDEETGTPPQDVVAAPPSGVALRWQHGVLAFWLAGALSWWGLTASRLVRFRRLLRHAVPADGLTQARTKQLARRLGLRRCPPVLLLPAPVPPMLWAVVGPPRVLLPAELWQRLSAVQRDTLLVHELAHLRRGDAWVRRLELLALGLYWWHPVAWWCRRALAEAEEQCCDAWVVWALPGAAEAYAAALVETVAFLAHSRWPVPAGASGMGHLPSLKRRLQMIVRESPPRQLSRVGVLALCALGAALLPLLPVRVVSSVTGEPLAAPVDLELEPQAPQEKPSKEPRSSPSKLSLDAARQIEAKKEQIELLKMDVKVMEAEFRAAQTQVEAARLRLRNQERARAAQTEITRSQDEVRTLLAQLARKSILLEHAQASAVAEQEILDKLFHFLSLPASPNAAHLFLKRTYDFGDVGKARQAAWSAQMVNKTEETYRISRVQAADPAVTAEPRSVELKPGDEGTIGVHLDPRRFRGPRTFMIWVHFSEPKQEQVLLEVKATNTQPGDGVPPPLSSGRVHELEKRLDKLLEEVEELRKELRPKKADNDGQDRR